MRGSSSLCVPDGPGSKVYSFLYRAGKVALASLMVVKQRALASWIAWAQTALASLMDSIVLDSLW